MKIYTYNNKIMTLDGKWMEQTAQPGPGPGPEPGLPSYTIRLKFTEGVTPSFSKGTAVQVSSSPNIWDLTYENTDWTELCAWQQDLIEVIDANTVGVTRMYEVFKSCNSLTSVPLFDTSSVTNMHGMFNTCVALTSVPLFDTSSVTDMVSMLYFCTTLTSIPLFDTSNATDTRYAFSDCYNVQSGAYALYQQASTQATPPIYYENMFRDCGRDTTTGRDELALIPTEWGGNDGELG